MDRQRRNRRRNAIGTKRRRILIPIPNKAEHDQQNRPGFERESRLDASGAGELQVKLDEQLRDEDELTIVTDGEELPFAFGGPVARDRLRGVGEPELDIELEPPGELTRKLRGSSELNRRDVLSQFVADSRTRVSSSR